MHQGKANQRDAEHDRQRVEKTLKQESKHVGRQADRESYREDATDPACLHGWYRPLSGQGGA
jgi:hypothetical protein